MEGLTARGSSRDGLCSVPPPTDDQRFVDTFRISFVPCGEETPRDISECLAIVL
jgi:hypothetical protein